MNLIRFSLQFLPAFNHNNIGTANLGATAFLMYKNCYPRDFAGIVW